MARLFTPIAESDFRDRLRAALLPPIVQLDEHDADELEEMTDEYMLGVALTYGSTSAKILGDFAKIDFDFENCYTSKDEVEYYDDPEVGLFVGINTLPNGLVYNGILVGGDWETPMFIIVYWSGKEFRGYIPEDGNTYNLVTKTAYGSEGNKTANPVNVPTDQQRQFNYQAIIADIQNRIQQK